MDTNSNKILARLESDLSYFMINEFCKNDPSKRTSTELYKYKGITISTVTQRGTNEHVLVVGIGALEAQFKIGSSDKVSGNLSPDEEKIIQIWLSQPDVNSNIHTALLTDTKKKKTMAIIPFDLEDYYA